MREMKDSGIEWIGKIPNNWIIGRIKDFYTFHTGFTPDTNNSSYYDDENGYEWVNISDISDNNKYIFNTKYKISEFYIKEKRPKFVEADSLLYSFKLSVGKCAFSGKLLFTNEAIASFMNSSNINLNYLYYSSFMIIENANINIYGARILNQESIKNALIIFPPLVEQKKIADFLDKKCSQIDSLRSDIEKQIEILEEYKKSIITEAVTKGLDTNIEMKDSGIEWIGKIPKDWEIIPFKYVLYERTEKNNPIQSTERLSLSIDAGVTLYSEKTTNLDRFKENFAAYKLAHKGDLVMNSMNMIVGATGVSKYYGCVSPAYYTFYDNTKDNLYTRYCEYIFKCRPMLRVLHSLGKGIYSIERGDDRVNTCRLKVSRYDLNKIEIPIPPVDIVYNILNYLDNKCSQTDSIIFVKKQQLESLDNYKKSLIYEYVTGKKEVTLTNE